jgi:protein-S-isoprenylcysteine O-methyltransferase Ste14
MDDPRKFPFPPVIPVAALILSWLTGLLWPIAIDWPSWTRPVGWVLLLAPMLLAIWGAQTFRQHHTVVDPRGDVTRLVTDGPFRFTRNPMYLSLIILYIGGTLAFHLSWGVVWLVPVFLALRYGVIAREEQYMKGKFGDEYDAYTRRVRRWL